ncbi:GNAT family N-acetyltransferase [Cohnella candidum]|uniref:GNAT family N-acetyltransferase n=1 Tax=Cohnella candidum TaxID=2674991 RepID=A0A3G3JW86_9BACL|nr:GNAT family N-acetyltransferase [Cohnella candidum]AYQ72485.1 GNAT family N-acetyltransferase [Cohnella candidum]
MRISKVELNDKGILMNLMTLFLHDLSEFNNDLEINQSNGLFEFDVFEWFFEKEGLTPFFIYNESKIIGFILLQSGPYTNQEFADYVLNSFFIQKKYRRQGLGREACKLFFKQFPGRYAISQLKNNVPAVQFWKNIYKSIDVEFYEKEEIEDGHEVVYQYFKV